VEFLIFIVYILMFVVDLYSGWAYATQKLYFEPVGIKAEVPFSWDEATVEDIKARNPSLKDVEFMLPSDSSRPYPLIGAGIVGPNEGGGYAYSDRNMTFLEMTPLYVGKDFSKCLIILFLNCYNHSLNIVLILKCTYVQGKCDHWMLVTSTTRVVVNIIKLLVVWWNLLLLVLLVLAPDVV
jgi:hypothetical protein